MFAVPDAASHPVVVEDLVVRYGDLVAVDHVSFHAAAGAVTAVLGPNGAGKTSTIEVCEGYRTATSGRVSVLGLDPHRDQAKLSERMGIMLQEGGVSPSARVADVVRLYCDLYGKGVEPAALLDTVGLTERSRTAYRRLSGGEKQRLSLSLALAAQPDVAFLDEPTSGVDIAGRQAIRTIVRGLAANGCAVVLATHELDEAEKIADHVIIFDHGHVVADGSLDELRRGHDEIRFRTAPTLDRSALGAALGVEVRAAGGPATDTAEYVVDGDASLVAPLTAWLAAHGEPIADLRAGQQRLEDVFLRLTGDSASSGSPS
ncbi:MAG: ABC-type multidrug transport system ATPase componen [Ilumatobacteraceae bacterium]|nr:ABC-type multidrug transport system ATPase componen [Ilumatobacteraceae bacterium]